MSAWDFSHWIQRHNHHRRLVRAIERAAQPQPQPQPRPIPVTRVGWYWDASSRHWWWWDGLRYTHYHP